MAKEPFVSKHFKTSNMAGGSSTTAVEGSSSAAPLNGGGEGGGKGGGGGGGVEEEEEVSCAVGTKIYVPDAVSVWKTAEVIKIEDDGGIVARVDADNDIVHIKKGDQFYLCNTGTMLTLPPPYTNHQSLSGGGADTGSKDCRPSSLLPFLFIARRVSSFKLRHSLICLPDSVFSSPEKARPPQERAVENTAEA